MAITCTIDASGIAAPTLSDIRAYLVSQYQGIYGSDVNLDPDTQDGQWIGIMATAVSDANAETVAVYNAFSPSTAQGVGLSRVVKINGIARLVATNSTVDLLIGGTAGTVISGGYATDANSVKWMLPATVTIPVAGQITVTATASDIGAIEAAAATITTIGTPTRGWQTVTNALAAVPGSPVEKDATLRARQRVSTALPSQTVLDGILGAVKNVSGVTRAKAYENDTSSTDGNGLPAHSISVVAEGGDAVAIASAIALKKTPGAYTYGTTSESVTDAYGIPRTIRFMRPTSVPITASIAITALPGYTSAIGAQIQAAVVAYLNSLDIGDDVYLTRLFVPANLSGGTGSETFDITSILIARDAGTPGSSNVVLAFNEVASGLVANITLTVT